MRVLITGAQGQVGQALVLCAPAHWQVQGLASSELDITDAAQVTATVQMLQPQLIINSAAYTAVDKAETDSARAHAVNHIGAANLAKAAHSLACPLLHISTDYVFSGDHSRPYTEQDTPAPNSVYGLSKWLGEQAIHTYCPQHIILRTSWVFGLHGNNFVKTMLRLSREHDVLNIVNDQVGAPTSAQSLAQALWQIAWHYQKNGSCTWGTYHLSGSPACNWYIFAQEIFAQAFELKLIQRCPVLNPISSEQHPTAAQRPSYSVLDNKKIQQQFNILQNNWKTELSLMLQAFKDAQ
ncbi:MAG TPA: dTDP-4-dehydrorhamnose reductase [Pseudomonas sp.]|nr:dTDP-4-dehydrorhamnose reductase [Pseudomonas sp.]